MAISSTLAALSSVSLRRLEDCVSLCLLITEQYLKEQYPAFSLTSFNTGEGLFMAALPFSHHRNYKVWCLLGVYCSHPSLYTCIGKTLYTPTSMTATSWFWPQAGLMLCLTAAFLSGISHAAEARVQGKWFALLVAEVYSQLSSFMKTPWPTPNTSHRWFIQPWSRRLHLAVSQITPQDRWIVPMDCM